jgi:UDP-glucose 4-epimerase
VQASVDDPVKTHQSNFIGTLNVCEAMRQAGVKRVLFASSAAVYGNNGEGESIDEDTPKAPLTPYASDKLASDTTSISTVASTSGAGDLPLLQHLRPTSGPSSPYSGVISILASGRRKACRSPCSAMAADPRFPLRRGSGRRAGAGNRQA